MFTGAYVTQGPRSLKEAPSIIPAAGFPAPSTDMPTNPAPKVVDNRSTGTTGTPDVSHVSLQLAWSPPTPFSLPATPSQSPFLYPADVPDYEFVDARLLGYDPAEWPEFEDQRVHYRRAPLPLMLDSYVFGKAPRMRDFDGPLLLTSVSMTVHFSTKPSAIEGVSSSLIRGQHQMAYFSQDVNESMQAVHVRNLDNNTQRLVQSINASNRVYHVDFPIHLPSSTGDREFLIHATGTEHHVKTSTGLHTGDTIPPHDEELKVVSEVYFFSGPESNRGLPESLEEFQDVALIKKQQGHPNSALFAHGLGTSFGEKLWVDLIKGKDTGKYQIPHKHLSNHSYSLGADLSRYALVQNVVSRSHQAGSKPLLTIVYTPRMVTSPQTSTARFVLREENDAAALAGSEAGYESTVMDDTPISAHRPLLKQTEVPLRRSRRSSSTAGAMRHDVPTSKASLHRPSFPVDTAGPVRNTRSQSRTRNSMLMRRPTTASSPHSGIQLPLTPRASPLISMQPSRRNSIVPSHLPPTPAFNSFAEQQQHQAEYASYGTIASPAPGTGIFDAGHADEWSSIMGAPSSFSPHVNVSPAYGVWPYPRAESGDLRPGSGYQQPQQGEFIHPSYASGDHTTADRFPYYSGAPWS